MRRLDWYVKSWRGLYPGGGEGGESDEAFDEKRFYVA
jgi:hypothetical protein